jgi:hypothetical protein
MNKTTVIIDAGNNILNPDDLQAKRAGPIVWLIYNHDSVAHKVSIDPDSFRIKGTTSRNNPLDTITVTALTADVGPNQLGLITANIKDNATYAKYKYDITSQGGKPMTLDPDLDVVDP